MTDYKLFLLTVITCYILLPLLTNIADLLNYIFHYLIFKITLKEEQLKNELLENQLNDEENTHIIGFQMPNENNEDEDI